MNSKFYSVHFHSDKNQNHKNGSMWLKTDNFLAFIQAVVRE